MPEIPKIILLIESSRAYGRGLLTGIAKYSRLHGPWAFYNEPEYSRLPGPGMYEHKNKEPLMPRFRGWHADGIIARIPDLTKARKILPDGVPVVAITARDEIKGLPHVVANEVKISEMAASHLLERGFAHFGFCGFDDAHWSGIRSQSFTKTIAKAGHKTGILKLSKLRNKLSWYEELNAIADWLKILPKPAAIMACNDIRARHAIEACKVSSLSIPEQVAVIGVDNDTTVCELSDPPLSSVALNTEKAGYKAAELLHKLIRGKKIKNQRVIIEPTHVVTRKSTDILAIENQEVVKAISFIRQYIRQPIQVSDVVAATAVSRRAIQRQFQTNLGRTIQQEIKRVRIQEITRLLIETHMLVSQIAIELGYPSFEHISRYFRSATGMSPQTYRKRYQ